LRSINSIWRLAFGEHDGSERFARPPGIQRLAVPHQFNEGLGVRDAAIAAAQACLRIFLTCLLFALWGVFAIWLWPIIGAHFWRWPVMALVAALFLGSFLAAMVAISLAVKALAPRPVVN
jgi:hypothetical protein